MYLSLSRSSADGIGERDYTVMAIDRKSGKEPTPAALAKMRYFLAAFKPDPVKGK